MLAEVLFETPQPFLTHGAAPPGRRRRLLSPERRVPPQPAAPHEKPGVLYDGRQICRNPPCNETRRLDSPTRDALNGSHRLLSAPSSTPHSASCMSTFDSRDHHPHVPARAHSDAYMAHLQRPHSQSWLRQLHLRRLVTQSPLSATHIPTNKKWIVQAGQWVYSMVIHPCNNE